MNRFVIRLIAAVAAALAIMSLTEAAGAHAPSAADPCGAFSAEVGTGSAEKMRQTN